MTELCGDRWLKTGSPFLNTSDNTTQADGCVPLERELYTGMTMDKKERNLLEKAYEAEINSAMNKNIPHLMQTKSKTAKKLVDDLLLAERTIVFNGMIVKGYELTHAGRMLYCIGC